MGCLVRRGISRNWLRSEVVDMCCAKNVIYYISGQKTNFLQTAEDLLTNALGKGILDKQSTVTSRHR